MPDLLRRLGQTALEYSLNDAFNAMIPQNVPSFSDLDQGRREVNLMIVRVLKSSHPNVLFIALIGLLSFNILIMQRSPMERITALEKSSTRIKSIAKVAKHGFKECEVNPLLRDIHVFLKPNPVGKDAALCQQMIKIL